MKKLGFTVILIAMLTGCTSITTARYSVSIDNNQALKAYAGSAVKLESLTLGTKYDADCRMAGPIMAIDKMTINQFVMKAINDELKFGNVYSESGTKLTGTLTKVEFSSSEGLTNGWWDLYITLDSSNGKSMQASNKYDFKSGFDAITACNNTAQALGPAVQDLINVIVSDPAFKELIAP
ncbi:MAG: hypothetical protein NWQ54_22225 [Paraglaciecola sp.]|nr:hypothetical protein [Paraglaciecola sp.]